MHIIHKCTYILEVQYLKNNVLIKASFVKIEFAKTPFCQLGAAGLHGLQYNFCTRSMAITKTPVQCACFKREYMWKIITKQIYLFYSSLLQRENIKLEHVKWIKSGLSHSGWVCFTPGGHRDGYISVCSSTERGGSVVENTEKKVKRIPYYSF